jgi:hypothetical protein
LFDLHADYLFSEDGDLDSGYMFVSLFSRPRGRALSFGAVCELIGWLRRRDRDCSCPRVFRHASIGCIDQSAWQAIEYPLAVYDESTDWWISRAEGRRFTAPGGKKADQVPGRLVPVVPT